MPTSPPSADCSKSTSGLTRSRRSRRFSASFRASPKATTPARRAERAAPAPTRCFDRDPARRSCAVRDRNGRVRGLTPAVALTRSCAPTPLRNNPARPWPRPKTLWPGSDPRQVRTGRGEAALDKRLQPRTRGGGILAEQSQYPFQVEEGLRRRPADRGGVAAPPPIRRVPAKAGANWIER